MASSAADTTHAVYVTVHSANDLVDTQTFGTQDPYVTVHFGEEEFRTHVHDNGGKNGRFDEVFVFNKVAGRTILTPGRASCIMLKALNQNITDR